MNYSKELDSIRRGRTRPPLHQALTRHSVPSDYAAFQCDVALVKSRYGQLSEYRFLENTSHYDEDDKMMYTISKVEWWEQTKGEMHIVAHRVQCKYQHGYCITAPQTDFISIQEAMRYTGYTIEKDTAVTSAVMITAEDSIIATAGTRKRQRKEDNTVTTPVPTRQRPAQQEEATPDRVHCHCKKRNGDYCLAKLCVASRSAQRHPNATYWACARKTIQRCDFWHLAAADEDLEVAEAGVGVAQRGSAESSATAAAGRMVTDLDPTDIICSRCMVKGHFARSCTTVNSAGQQKK